MRGTLFPESIVITTRFTIQRTYRFFRPSGTASGGAHSGSAPKATSRKPSKSTGTRRFLPQVSNSNPASFGAAILGAEYIMRMLPRGTHHYAQFLKPSELGRLLRQAGLELEDVSGLGYNPVNRKAWLSRFTAVNYLLSARKPV